MNCAAITWVGHATVLLELDGVRLLTDPIVRERIGPLVRIAPPARVESLGTLDGVLVSHLHADHADPRSLRLLARTVPVVAPRSAGSWLRRAGLADVRELSPGEGLRLGGLRVEATPAVHPRRRTPLGPAADPVGYLAEGSISIYFPGDTDLHAGIGQLAGSVDVALMPVWGWGPSVGAGHLNPERAARAVAMLAPRLVIPIHWGTFALPWARRAANAGDQPARVFAELARRYAPRVEVRVLAHGERTLL